MPRLLLVSIALVLLLGSACGGGDDGEAADLPTSQETVTVTAAPTPEPTPSPAPDEVSDLTTSESLNESLEELSPATDLSQYDAPGFTTPSGNIGCQFDDRPHVRCDRLQMTGVPSGKPADCDFDWGHSVELVRGRPGALACTSDSVMGQQGETDGSRALPYGDSVVYQGILCTSTRKGLRCSARGHGFLISRATISVS